MNLFQEAKNVLDKDGKVNALGPYGRQKLTGRELSTYFRRNKVKDAQIKKAVEVALDLGGADSIARREIKKFYGDKILKSKEVQQALQYANEEVFKEDLNKDDAVLEENYRVLAKKGMGAETKNSIKVGTEVDYYRADGAKYMGKIIKMGPKSYIVKDMKNGKNYQFMYHDRVKAKQYLKQGDNINEKLDLVVTVKGDKNVALALKAMKKFKGVSVLRQGKVKSGKVAVFGGDEKQLQKMQSSLAGQIKGLDMVSTHEMVSVNEADAEKKAELALKQTREKEALAKKHEREKESIADSYRRMWEDETLDENLALTAMLGLAASLLPFIYLGAKELAGPSIEKLVDKLKKNKNYKMSNSEKSDVKGFLSKVKKEKPSAYKKAEVKAKSMKEAANPAQQAAIAISKKEKAGKPGYDKEGKSLKKESVMDSYRQMWEDAVLEEEVANITVDPKNRISKPADQNKHAMEINKQAKRFGLKSSMMGKHLRIKGNKKAVNDFLRTVIGKSRYGDPTEKDMSTPQVDKMLTKGLK